MLVVEKAITLDSADAVAVLISEQKLICYSLRLSEDLQEFLSPYLISALGEGERVRAITVPRGAAALMRRTGFDLDGPELFVLTQRCAGCTCADVPQLSQDPPTLPFLPFPGMPA